MKALNRHSFQKEIHKRSKAHEKMLIIVSHRAMLIRTRMKFCLTHTVLATIRQIRSNTEF